VAETIQEMIARKRRERDEGKKPEAYDNKAALKNLHTEVSTAKYGTEAVGNNRQALMENRKTIDMQSNATKTGPEVDEPGLGQKLLEERRKRAKAKAYIESN
jgi:hypothetical protein